MITNNGTLRPIETDNEKHQELVDMYNQWYSEVCFLSNINWLNTNESWKKMHEYCEVHPDILKEFWLDMKESTGEVGHFTFMLNQVLPNKIEVIGGYVPLKDIEAAWKITLYADKNETLR